MDALRTYLCIIVVFFIDNGDESSPHDNSFNASGESLVSCETNGFGSQVCFKESKIPATSAKGE